MIVQLLTLQLWNSNSTYYCTPLEKYNANQSFCETLTNEEMQEKFNCPPGNFYNHLYSMCENCQKITGQMLCNNGVVTHCDPGYHLFRGECVRFSQTAPGIHQAIGNDMLVESFELEKASNLKQLMKNVNTKFIPLINQVFDEIKGATLGFNEQMYQVNHPSELKRTQRDDFIRQLPDIMGVTTIKNKNPVDYSADAFYFKCGLKSASSSVLNYIKDKDILDIGAGYGSAALNLMNFTSKSVFSFEFNPQITELYREDMALNNITDYNLHQLHLSDTEGQAWFTNDNSEKSLVNISTIDIQAKLLNLTPGFVKLELIGRALAAIKGSISTLKQFRPVLSVKMNGSYEDLFKVKPFLEENLENYVFEYLQIGLFRGIIDDLVLFAYPKELAVDEE
ncbi:Methyltransferase [Hexamita inflata]|uniref:Methyltransferase n=1 Tax=Hexamita inflata TaxID=28002 RepID=A0ABP1HQU0_9EUKA